MDEMDISATAVLRVPARDRDASNPKPPCTSTTFTARAVVMVGLLPFECAGRRAFQLPPYGFILVSDVDGR